MLFFCEEAVGHQQVYKCVSFLILAPITLGYITDLLETTVLLL